MCNSLLKTKLYIPEHYASYMERSRLLGKLEAAMRQNKKLLLVCAPAGYGKSVLVSRWLRLTGKSYAWYSLDNGDNDLFVFMNYLLEAVKTIEDKLGEDSSSILHAMKLPNMENVINTLINAIAGYPESITIVLDDFHLLQDASVLNMVQYILDKSSPNLQLVIITREDPPLSLSRLRVQGRLFEIRAEELRFTHEEASGFFENTMGTLLKDETVKLLNERTEGWAAGLQLTALTIQRLDEKGIDEFIRDFSGSCRYIIEYLVSEVLQNLSMEIKRFLILTSALERFNSSMCREITGCDHSDEILSAIERSNLFLIPLDERHQWFRYHHLFSDFLQTELDSDEKAEIQNKAAVWYEANGYMEEAIKYRLSSGDMKNAGRLIESSAIDMMKKGNLLTLLKWMDALPEQIVDSTGELAVYKAWCMFITGRIQDALAYSDLLETKLKGSGNQKGLGMILALKTLGNLGGHNEATLKTAREAVEMIGHEDKYFRIVTLQALGQAEASTGAVEAAVSTFGESYELCRDISFDINTVVGLDNLAINLYKQGRKKKAQELCIEGLMDSRDVSGKLHPLAAMIYIPLGLLSYEENSLAEAREYLEKGLAYCRQQSLVHMIGYGEWAYAMLQEQAGEGELALAGIRELRRGVRRLKAGGAVYALDAIEAELNIRLANTIEVEKWMEANDFEAVVPAREFQHITYVRALMLLNHYRRAVVHLNKLEDSALHSGRMGRLIQIYVLRAAAEKALSNDKLADEYMGRALRLAEGEGYVRSFLDAGKPVFELLCRRRELGEAFTCNLLEAFREELKEAVVNISGKAAMIYLEEALSDREMEILQCISGGMSNGDIAGKLFITLGTVKWHTNNIYGKLGVRSRTQAVSKARELGLIG